MRDIIRWDPFSELSSIQDELDRLFGRTFGGIEPIRGRVTGAWVPPLDVVEQDDAIVARLDLPGIAPEDVEVALEDSTLTVSGSRSSEESTERTGYHRIERRVGAFSRSIALPSTADPDRVEASFDRGVLTITIGKVAASRPRRIEIKAGA